MTDHEAAKITQAVAKAARDFYHYFQTLDSPKLEEWIEDAVKNA